MTTEISVMYGSEKVKTYSAELVCINHEDQSFFQF